MTPLIVFEKRILNVIKMKSEKRKKKKKRKRLHTVQKEILWSKILITWKKFLLVFISIPPILALFVLYYLLLDSTTQIAFFDMSFHSYSKNWHKLFQDVSFLYLFILLRTCFISFDVLDLYLCSTVIYYCIGLTYSYLYVNIEYICNTLTRL